MVARVQRQAIGYSWFNIQQGQGRVYSAQSMTLYSTISPGEMLGIQIAQIDGALTDFLDLKVKLDIDSVTLFDGYLYWFLMGYNGYPFYSLFATNDNLNGFNSISHFQVVIPYENGYSVKLYTTNGAGNEIFMNINTRYGA